MVQLHTVVARVNLSMPYGGGEGVVVGLFNFHQLSTGDLIEFIMWVRVRGKVC